MNENPDLLTLFKAKRAEIGSNALAEALGIKNTSTIRMICSGKYPNPEHVLKSFAQVYINVLHCPYVDRALNREECTTRANGPKPFGGYSKSLWWQACQSCPQKRSKP